MLMPAMLPGTEAMVEALQGFVTWRHPHVTVSEMCATSSSPAYLVRPLAVQLEVISHYDYCQVAAWIL